MIIKTKKRENPFAQIDRAVFEDDRISWKAKGVLGYLLSKPGNWEVRIKDLINRGPDGKAAIKSAMRELREAGYAKLKPSRGKNGKLAGKYYEITERPIFRPSEKPTVGKTDRREIGLYSNKKEVVIRNSSNKEDKLADKPQPKSSKVNWMKKAAEQVEEILWPDYFAQLAKTEKGKEFKSLQNLLQKIAGRQGLDSYAQNGEICVEGLAAFLEAFKENRDKWQRQNVVTVAMLNSQFTRIVNGIKNGKADRKIGAATGTEIAEALSELGVPVNGS